MKSIRKKVRPVGPLGYENYPYAKLYYYMFYKPGDIAVTTGQHWVLNKKTHKEAISEVKNGRIKTQLQKEKWKFNDLIILGIWNVSTHANISGHFAKNTEFDKFLNRQLFKYDVDRTKSELIKNDSGHDSEQILLKDIYNGPKRVDEWLKNGAQPIEDEEEAREFGYRDHLHEEDHTQFDKDFRKPAITKLNQTRVDCIRACGAGKSQDPYLAYYRTYIDFWEEKGQPINITLGPDNGIVRGNAMGMSGHDQAVGNDTLHIVWTSDAIDDLDASKRTNLVIAKSQHEVRDVKGKVVEKSLSKGEVFRKLLTDNKHRPIMVHCGYAGYYARKKVKGILRDSNTCLSYQMRRANKTFFWAFMDEVHRTLGADWAAWSKIHDDSIVFIKHRFMPTATPNKLKSAKKDYNEMYGMGNFADVTFPPLDNIEAFKRGYIRKYKVFQLSFGDDLPAEVFEKIGESKEPYIKVKGTDVTVPFKYWMELKTFYEFKRLYPNINHTLGINNRINNSRLYANFIDVVKKPMLLNMFGGNYNDPEYKRLINIHIEAMTTDEDENGLLRAKADEIGKKYKDSLILHCQLLGEGWNPGGSLSEKDKKYKGFIDSIQFIDPVHSKMRIAQNAGRGVRSPFLKPNCWLILSWLNVNVDNKLSEHKNNYNKRAKILHDVAVALGVPGEFVHDQIVLKTCKPISRPPTGPGHGPDNIDSDIEIDPFADEFLSVMEGIRDGCGAIHPLHPTVEKIAIEWIKYLEMNNYQFFHTETFSRQALKEPFYEYIRNHDEIGAELEEWLLTDEEDKLFNKRTLNIFRQVVDGKHSGNSLKTHIALDEANDKLHLFPQIDKCLKELRKEVPLEVFDALKTNKVFLGSGTFKANEFLRKYNAREPEIVANYNKKLIPVFDSCTNVTPLGEPFNYDLKHTLRKYFWLEDWWETLEQDVQIILDDRLKTMHDIQQKYINISVTSDRLHKKANKEISEILKCKNFTVNRKGIWDTRNPSQAIIDIQLANADKVHQYVEQKLDAQGEEFDNCHEFCDWVSSTMLADIGVDPEENSPKSWFTTRTGTRTLSKGGQNKIVFWQFASNNPNRTPKFKEAYEDFLDRTNKRMGKRTREYKKISVEGNLYNNFKEIKDAGYTIDGSGGYKTTYKHGEVRPITDFGIRYRCRSDNFPDWIFVK